MNGPERKRSRSKRRPRGSSTGSHWPSDSRIAIGLIGLAWVHRIFFLLSNVDRSWGFSIFYEGDSETFYNFARAILAGTPYDGGIPFHPPVFPHFLSVVHMLLGAGDPNARVPYLPLKIVMALIGSVPIGLTYLLVRDYLGRPTALLASLLTLYSFGEYVISIAPVSEGLYSALLLLCVLIWARLTRRLSAGERSRGNAILAALLGILFGLLALTRAEGFLAAILLLVLLVARAFMMKRSTNATPTSASDALTPPTPASDALTPPAPASAARAALGQGNTVSKNARRVPDHRSAPFLRTALRLSALVLTTMVLTITPWSIRNAQYLRQANQNLAGTMSEPLPELVPITAYGPLNFALANHAGASGEFSRDILTSQRDSAVLDVRDPQHLRFFLHGYGIGWDWIWQHPGDFVLLVFKKWRLFFGSLQLGWTQWNVPGGLDGVRRPVDLFVPSSPAALFLTIPLLLLGAFLCTKSGARLRRNTLGPTAPSTTRFVGTVDPDPTQSSEAFAAKARHASAPGPGEFLLLVLVLTAASLATTALFFGYARLGVVLLPFWYSLMAVALAWIGSLVGSRVGRSRPSMQPSVQPGQTRHWPRVTPVTAMVAILGTLLLLETWGATGDRNFNATGTQAQGASHLNPHDTMRLELIHD